MSSPVETHYSNNYVWFSCDSSRAAILLAVALAAYTFLPFFVRHNIVNKDGIPIPPGPLLRYAFLRKYSERMVHRWAQKYGGLFSVWMGNQLTVVISDPVVARELLVNHGAIYSSRRMYFMKNQTILNSRAITATPYNGMWRHHRKLAMQELTPAAVKRSTHMIDYESHILIRSLFLEGNHGQEPINPAHCLGRYAFNNMCMLTFGTRTASTADPLTERALSLAKEFMELTGPWSNAIDFITPLQWIPTQMRSRGRKLHDDIIAVYGALIMRVKDRMNSGDNVPACLVKTLLETREKEGLSWEDMCMLSAVFTLGGVHSTSGILQWFLALLPSHPEVQTRVHDEMDRVIGREHWPTAQDEKDLPYTRAVIKEVARMHSPFWMATPHYSTEDFVYNGMFLPKDTSVVLNIYSLHHNEARYPDSFLFNPDRYLGDDQTSAESAHNNDAMKRDHWAFGAGRRICPGLHVAEREMWLAMSRVLWAFEVRSVPGESISLAEYEGESGRTPMPFRVKLGARHERVLTMLEAKDEASLFNP